MKRSHIFIVFIAIAILVGAGLFVAASWSQPSLTILINGAPAANLSVTDVQTTAVRKLDATGTIRYARDSSKQNAVFVPTKGGNQRMVSLPERGHKTVDLRGRWVVSKTVMYKFGFIRSEETTEQYDLTDAETAAIDAGEVTRSQVHQSIRAEAEQ